MRQNRNINIDYVKCIAAFMVILVHFFMHTGFYNLNIINGWESISFIIKQISVICVPLFIIVTGYLMCEKNISKKYFRNLYFVTLTYILISIISIFFRKFVIVEEISFKELILGIFTFKTNQYSWYVNMYIGLYLLIPFLNMIIDRIKNNRRMFLYLIVLLTIFTSIPKFSNYWYFGAYLYPITYYFIGSYFKYNFITVKLYIPIFFFICMLSIELIIGFIFNFNSGILNSYNSIFNLIKAGSLFAILLSLKLKSNNIVKLISEHTLSIYLVSFIIDKKVYSIFNEIFLTYNERVLNIWIVFFIFIISLLLSLIIDYLIKLFSNKIIFSVN